MILNNPVEITSRLLPGVRVGKSFVSIEYGKQYDSGRVQYRYYIDTPEFEYEGNDLKSGRFGGTLRRGLIDLLSFLSAAAEAYRYEQGGRKSDNADLFPPHVMEWCYQNDDEISLAQMELEENENAIEE